MGLGGERGSPRGRGGAALGAEPPEGSRCLTCVYLCEQTRPGGGPPRGSPHPRPCVSSRPRGRVSSAGPRPALSALAPAGRGRPRASLPTWGRPPADSPRGRLGPRAGPGLGSGGRQATQAGAADAPGTRLQEAPRPARPSRTRTATGPSSVLHVSPGNPAAGFRRRPGRGFRGLCSSWKWGGACLSSWGPSGARRLFLGWPVLPGQLWPGCLRPGASQGCRHVPGRFPGVVCDGSGPPRARGPGWQGSHPAQVGGVWVGRGDASPAETVGLCDAPICSTEKAQPSLHRLYCWRSSQVGGVLEPRCPSPRPLPAAQAAPLGPPLGCFDSVLIFCFF